MLKVAAGCPGDHATADVNAVGGVDEAHASKDHSEYLKAAREEADERESHDGLETFRQAAQIIEGLLTPERRGEVQFLREDGKSEKAAAIGDKGEEQEGTGQCLLRHGKYHTEHKGAVEDEVQHYVQEGALVGGARKPGDSAIKTIQQTVESKECQRQAVILESQYRHAGHANDEPGQGQLVGGKPETYRPLTQATEAGVSVPPDNTVNHGILQYVSESMILLKFVIESVNTYENDGAGVGALIGLVAGRRCLPLFLWFHATQSPPPTAGATGWRG